MPASLLRDVYKHRWIRARRNRSKAAKSLRWFRAFNGDLNAHHAAGPHCFARDARHADFVIYLHNAISSKAPTTLPNDARSLHWHITGLSQSSSITEQERSLRRTESELETRIKLLVLVYEREKKKRHKLPRRVLRSDIIRIVSHLTA